MEHKQYEVYFEVIDKQPKGTLMEFLGDDYTNVSCSFNPLTILGDLDFFLQHHEFDTSNINMTREIQYLVDTPYDTETGFDIPLDVAHNVKYFFLLDTLKEYVFVGTPLSLSTLIGIRDYFDINARINVRNNNLYKLPTHDMSENNPTTYRHFLYGQSDILPLFNGQYSEGDAIYYSCQTPSDVIFSILHYLITHHYSFASCAHCEKIFARIHNSIRYCPRQSPLEKYQNRDCKTAVKDFKRSCTRKKERIRNALEKRKTDDTCKIFKEAYEKIQKFTSTYPTPANLQKLENFVDRRKWGIRPKPQQKNKE